MTTTTTTLSFCTNKNTRQSVELLETKEDVVNGEGGVTFAIVQIGLSANNKFYLDFGEKAPFNFDKCYPINPNKSSLLFDDEDKSSKKVEDYIHPPVWGICKVTASSVDGVSLGSHYLAQLPMAESVSSPGGGHTVDAQGNLTIHRPTTHAAYNLFQKVSPNDTLLSKEYGALALVCFPGILTGFGLYFDLERHGYYGGAQNVVITSASSKVGLALALYLKEKKSGKKVVGYTSDANRDFCKSTGLYDFVLAYNDKLCDNNVVPKDESCVMVDISGNASVWSNNTAPSSSSPTKIAKLLVIGNSSGAPDDKSTFAHLSLYAQVKMMLTMFGAPQWMRSWMNPTQELFLIMDIVAALQDEWGLEKFNATKQEYAQTFCHHAIHWIKIRDCPTVGSIQKAFQDIVQGTVPPSDAIVMDVAKAVLPLKKK